MQKTEFKNKYDFHYLFFFLKGVFEPDQSETLS